MKKELNEFLKICSELTQKKQEEVIANKINPNKEEEYVLNDNQKKAIITYTLCYSKGILEDCDDFINEIEEEPEDWSSISNAVDNYIESLKEKLLNEFA